MLNEIRNVRQHPEEGLRRWFVDEDFDLIVWYKGTIITGFQLCYDKNNKERSLTWRADGGYSHNKIDDGEITGHNKMTPILVADGLFDKETIANRFKAHGTGLDRSLVDFVYAKLTTAYGI